MKAEPLLVNCLEACDVLSVLVKSLYSSISGESAKLKDDQSVFTIADGLVQGLLKRVLFGGNKFKAIVGEEDNSTIVITERPFKVDELVVPERFTELIEETREKLAVIGARLSASDYKALSIFIDPIDGTREFYSKLGEQCTICIGFTLDGAPWAGIVYRPVPSPVSWAAGCASQNLRLSKLKIEGVCKQGLLTSNGAISPFLEELMSELKFERVPSGGAGNKMLMLLERKGACYIQDRGLSRWDTAAAQAVLEAHGGVLCKMTSFLATQQVLSYRYDETELNLDFEPGVASLTKYNAKLTLDSPPLDKNQTADKVEQVKNYANLCGLVALSREALEPLLQDVSPFSKWHASLAKVAAKSPPQYD